MRCILAGFTAGLAMGLLACRPDPRKAVVEEFVEFARLGAYDVRVERDESNEYLRVVVQDTVLPRYTALIERLAADSAGARRAYYSNLPSFLSAYASIIDADPPTFSGDDTLEARVVFRRPDSTLFARRVTDWMGEQRRWIGSLATTMEEVRLPLDEPTLRREWAARYARSRQELRESDTLIMRVNRQGHLIELTTGGYNREVEAHKVQEAYRQAHTTRLLPAIGFRRLGRTVYDQMVSVEGTVSAGPVGWWPPDEKEKPFISYEVECRVAGPSDTLVSKSSVTVDDRTEPDRFICIWIQAEARRIHEIGRAAWQVRFRESWSDSARTGPWVDVK